jgi:hypothetical protein
VIVWVLEVTHRPAGRAIEVVDRHAGAPAPIPGQPRAAGQRARTERLDWPVQFESWVRRPTLLATLCALQVELTAGRADRRVLHRFGPIWRDGQMRFVYERPSRSQGQPTNQRTPCHDLRISAAISSEKSCIFSDSCNAMSSRVFATCCDLLII